MVKKSWKVTVLITVLGICFTFYLKNIYWDDPMLFIKYAEPRDLQNRYIHKHQYKYNINNEGLCNGQVFLLIFVPSDPQKAAERQLVRQTWGAVKQFANERIVTVFGTAQRVIQANLNKTKNINKALKEESDKYHDIVQGNFIDSYNNLTYKTIMALHWVTNYCPNAKFFLKTDDDIIPNLFKYIQLLLSLSVNELKNVIFCKPNISQPHRPNSTSNKKWEVSRTDYYPTYYPTYCAGPSYMMSIDVVYRLYTASQKVPFLYLEDVYLGLCRIYTGIRIWPIVYVHCDKACQIEDYSYVHYFIMKKSDDLKKWQTLWQQIISTYNRTNIILH